MEIFSFPDLGEDKSIIENVIIQVAAHNTKYISYLSIYNIIYQECQSLHGEEILRYIMDLVNHHFSHEREKKMISVFDDTISTKTLKENALNEISKLSNESYDSQFVDALVFFFGYFDTFFHQKGFNLKEKIVTAYEKSINDSDFVNCIIKLLSFLVDYSLFNFDPLSSFDEILQATEKITLFFQKFDNEKKSLFLNIITQHFTQYFNFFLYNCFAIQPPSENDESNLVLNNFISPQSNSEFLPSVEVISPKILSENPIPWENIVPNPNDLILFLKDLYRKIQFSIDLFSFFDTSFQQIISENISIFCKYHSYQACLNLIPSLCISRNIESFENLFKLSNIFTDFKEQVNEIIIRIICSENLDLNNKIQAAHFYKQVSIISNDSIILNSLKHFINRNSIQTIQDLLKAISSLSSLSNQEIIDSINNMSDFLTLFDLPLEFAEKYHKLVAKKLVSLSKQNVEKEELIFNSILKFRSELKNSPIKFLIDSGKQSLESHYGPILIAPSQYWPFLPPYPSPMWLKEVLQDFQKIYINDHPNQHLTFPINFWRICIKDLKRGVIFQCNGIQAEILLSLNNASFLSETSLLPSISPLFLIPALESLCLSSCPILTKKDNIWILNSDFNSFIKKKKSSLFILQEPSLVKDDSEVKKENETEMKAIEAFIIRLMKKNRVSSKDKIINSVLSEFNDKFSIKPQDILLRIESLKAREFLKEGKNDIILYIV